MVDWGVLLTAFGGLFTAVMAALAGLHKGRSDSARKDYDQITKTYGRLIGDLRKQNESQQRQINLLTDKVLIQSREHERRQAECIAENEQLKGQLSEALSRINSLEAVIVELKTRIP